MAQFQRVKANFPDHLLLFQVGDFYELYGEDASKSEIEASLWCYRRLKGIPPTVSFFFR